MSMQDCKVMKFLTRIKLFDIDYATYITFLRIIPR